MGNQDHQKKIRKISKFQLAFRIHLILTWIRIRILGSTFEKSGSGSLDPPFRNSGSGPSDPTFGKSGSGSGSKVDPDPGPKWIRIRVPNFNIFSNFYKEIHACQSTILTFVTA